MLVEYDGGKKVAIDPKPQGPNVLTFKDLNDIAVWINANITAITGKQSTLTADQIAVIDGEVYDSVSKKKLDDIDLSKYYLKTEVDVKEAALQKEIDIMKSAGIHIPHYATNTERDTAIPKPDEGQVAYVGSNGDWTLTTYANAVWEDGTKSNHSTTGEDPKKADIDLSNINLGSANKDKIFTVGDDGGLILAEPSAGGNPLLADYEFVGSLPKADFSEFQPDYSKPNDFIIHSNDRANPCDIKCSNIKGLHVSYTGFSQVHPDVAVIKIDFSKRGGGSVEGTIGTYGSTVDMSIWQRKAL